MFFFGECLKFLEYRGVLYAHGPKIFSVPAGRNNFDETEPLFVQYLSESTVFGVKSLSK